MPMTLDEYIEASKSLEEARQRRVDSYRPFLQFLIGHLTFTGIILVGALASLPKTGAELTPPMAAALGGVVAWMAISALAASLVALVVQGLRLLFLKRGRQTADEWTKLTYVLCLIPVVPGVIAVVYCVRAGAALLGKTPVLPQIFDAFKNLFV
jgi:succinate dehydrogenase/fumarate reductase cytochrome b subunit